MSAMINRKVIRKLLGHNTTAPTERVDTSVPDYLQLRPSAPQNNTHNLGVAAACLDRSPDGQRAVVAGSQLFKVVKIDGDKIKDDFNVRATLTSRGSSHDPSAATAEQLNIKTIRWSHGTMSTTVITACWNGRITVYDLNRANEGLEVGRIKDHARAVHKLAINPFKPIWLLSASQDGTVKSFDIRMPTKNRAASYFPAGTTFKGNAEAVRDVAWSPSDGMEFACATDAGIILKWDARKSTAPILKLPAHDGACLSIAWHPDGQYLVSGGLDQKCHVWDLSKTAERNQNSRYSFVAPAPISTVAWRPACWSATAQGKRAAQVTVAYDDSNSSKNQTSAVHIWDLARPGMPYKEIERWKSAPTGILWNTRDLLWSVDSEGMFTQTDIAFVPQAVDSRSLSTIAFSPTGDILMLLEERKAPQRVRPSMSTSGVSPSIQRDAPVPLFSVSRSDSEDDVVGSFLGPRHRKGLRRRRSERSGQLSTTPPIATGMADKRIMSLDEAVDVTGLYKPQQVVAIGHAPGAMKRSTYHYYTNRYLSALESYVSVADDFPKNVRAAAIMETFAKIAEHAAHFRLAQTWRVLAHTINLLLVRRAEYHRQKRLAPPAPKEVLPKKSLRDFRTRGTDTPRRGRSERGGDTPRRQLRAQTPAESPIQHPARVTLSEEPESTSNVTTPLARPVRDTISYQTREAMHTPMTVEDDPLSLSEAAVEAPSSGPIPVPGSKCISNHTKSSVEGYDFYGVDSFSPVVDYVSPLRKPLLQLEHAEAATPQRIQPHRHDSSESFQMFSTSGDSQVAKFMSSSESEGRNSLGRDSHGDLRDRVVSWESSFGSSRMGNDHQEDNTQTSSMDTNSAGAAHNRMNGNFHVPPILPILRIQEASGPATQDQPPLTGSTTQTGEDVPILSKLPQNSEIISSDFDPWQNDPSFAVSPIDPTVLVQRTINFEVQTGALHAAIMILLLRPLLPEDAIDDIQAPAILRSYHQRLTTFQLFPEAALLRNLSVPTYPTVFADAQENITIGFFCTDCNKPIENDPLIPGSVWNCPRCKGAVDACAICHSREIIEDGRYFPKDGNKMGFWFLCPGCGHGGHTSCMQAWYGLDSAEGEQNSGGCCPLEGCLHPCLPGDWRQKREGEKAMLKSRELEGLVRENSRGSAGRGTGRSFGVRRDVREVNQSRAVEGVRIALNVGNVGVGSSGLERKKSVKLVAPWEE